MMSQLPEVTHAQLLKVIPLSTAYQEGKDPSYKIFSFVTVLCKDVVHSRFWQKI